MVTVRAPHAVVLPQLGPSAPSWCAVAVSSSPTHPGADARVGQAVLYSNWRRSSPNEASDIDLGSHRFLTLHVALRSSITTGVQPRPSTAVTAATHVPMRDQHPNCDHTLAYAPNDAGRYHHWQPVRVMYADGVNNAVQVRVLASRLPRLAQQGLEQVPLLTGQITRIRHASGLQHHQSNLESKGTHALVFRAGYIPTHQPAGADNSVKGCRLLFVMHALYGKQQT